MTRYLFVVFAAVVLLPGGAKASIGGSPHNSNSESCVYCHYMSPREGLLEMAWGSAGNQPAKLGLYERPSRGGRGEPQGVSLLCLSCHDGAMADGPLGNIAKKSLLLGQDGLGNDHPISISYDPRPGRDLQIAINGKVGDLPLYQAPDGGAGIDQVECTTCHDPHATSSRYYLRMSNGRSELCLTCHDK